MSDLGTQIRSYYEDVVERVDPMTQPPMPSRESSYRPALVLVAAVVAVLVVIGLAPFLARWVADDSVVDEPTTVTTLPIWPIVSTTVDASPPPDGTVSGSRIGLDVELIEIVAASWGYVAVGFDPEDGRTSALFSTDAASWVPAPITVDTGTVVLIDSLTSWNDQILAIGFIDEGDPHEVTFLVFATSNGMDWEPMPFDVVEAPAVIAGIDSELILTEISRQADGTPISTQIHRSADGVTWSTVEIPRALMQDGEQFPYVFDASDGAIGLSGRDNRNSLVTLLLDADGQWTRIEQDLGWDFDLSSVTTGPNVVMATGTKPDDRVNGGIPREGTILLWTPEGWQETMNLGALHFSGMTYDGHRYVAVGTDGDRLPGVWESSDWLADWNRIVGGSDTLTEMMPGLVGKPWPSIEEVWRLRGSYQVDFIEEFAAQGDGGVIVSTDPAAGGLLAFEQHVQIVVTRVEITEAGASPWSNPPLKQIQVPDELIRGWSDPEYQVCPALGFIDQEDEASPRLGGYGSVLSYDNPDGPGSRGDSSPCTNCGRSAYGVSLGRVSSPDDMLKDWARWPAYHFDWRDGSMAIIRAPYASGPYNDIDPETGEATEPTWDANVWFDDDCSYGVWSRLSSEHLLALLEDLRFVEGLTPP